MKKRLLLLSATFLVSILGFAQNAKPIPTFSDMATDGTVQYLYNKDAGGFFVGANDWNTRASVGEYGAPIRMEKRSNAWAIACKPLEGGRAGQWCYVSCDSWGDNIWVDALLNNSNYQGCETWGFTKQADGGYKFTNTNSVGVMSLPEYADGNTRIYMDPSGEGDRPQSDVEGEYLQVKGNEIYLTNVNEYVACQMDVTLEEGDVLEDIGVTNRISQAFTVDFSEVVGNDNTYRIVIYTSRKGAFITGNSGAILTLTITGKGEDITISNAKFAKSDETGYWVGQKFGSDDEEDVFGDTWYFVSEADYKAYQKDYDNYCSITVHVEEAGTLGEKILEKIDKFSDVKSLVVTGNLNADDAARIKNALNNVEYIDLSETTLTALPDEMFRGKNLLQVILPKNLNTIGELAFMNCLNLTSLELPESLTRVDYMAFAYSGIKSIHIPASIKNYGNWLFEGCQQLSEATFAEGFQVINYATFWNCTALKSVTFPSTLTEIGGSAFYNCSALASISLNEGLTFIGENAFSSCQGLKEVVLPSTLTSVYNAFVDCNNLTTMTCYALVPPANQGNNVWTGKACDLYVPNLSLNQYKLTPGWDEFTFTHVYGKDHVPNDINIANYFTLNVDDALCAVDDEGNYIHKPNIWLLLNNQNTTSGWTEYGALTTKGDQDKTLSAGIFSMVSDPNYKYDHWWYANNGELTRTGTTLISNVPMRADSVTTLIYLTSNMWNFLSFPYDVKVSDIIPVWPNDFVIRKYDGEARANTKMDETWVDMGPDDILEANQGYIWMISERKEIYENGNWYWRWYDAYNVPAIDNAQKNNLFTTGDVEIALAEYTTEFEHNRSWNLIGNPYPCYYDTRAMNFDAPFTIWNFQNQAYEAYSATDDDYILDPNEAFFVQRPINQASIIFHKAGRQHTSEAAERGTEAKTRNAEASARSVFNLTLSDGEKTDRTRVVLNEQAQMDYELDKDASKFKAASALVPQFFTINKGVRYAINERPFDNGTVRLGYTVAANGAYTIALNTKANCVVMLEDTETGELVNLTEGAYSFSATAGTNEGRFLLHFSEEDATRIETIAAAETANGSELYTLDGRRVNGTATQGVYLVKKGQKFQKIFVK